MTTLTIGNLFAQRFGPIFAATGIVGGPVVWNINRADAITTETFGQIVPENIIDSRISNAFGVGRIAAGDYALAHGPLCIQKARKSFDEIESAFADGCKLITRLPDSIRVAEDGEKAVPQVTRGAERAVLPRAEDRFE
jgi:hypothetical protein